MRIDPDEYRLPAGKEVKLGVEPQQVVLGESEATDWRFGF